MSKTKKKLTMNASLLRILLIVFLLITSVAGAFGFSYAIDLLKKYAVEVSHEKVDAVASNGTIQSLKQTQVKLDNNKDVLEKIGLLRSSSDFPEFRIVDEVRKIAAKNNIEISSFSYGSSGDAAASSGSAAPATTTPAPAATTTPTAAATGGSSISLTVTPKATSYLDFLQFTYDIEQNLPKMKIQGISIKSGSGAESISVQPVVIEMYIQ